MEYDDAHHLARVEVGLQPHRSTYYDHLNGNAIYRLGDRCFETFLRFVRAQHWAQPFDASIAFIMHDPRNFRLRQMLEHRFWPSNFIVNYGLAEFDERELSASTYFVHGKFMYKSEMQQLVAGYYV